MVDPVSKHPRHRALISAAASWGSLVVLLWGALRLLAPLTTDWQTYGFHDWDAAATYRHVTTLSLLHYGELPFWHPWLCGGVPAFGYAEGAPNLVSPYLPVYLLADVPIALRIEVMGATLTAAATTYLLAGRLTSSAPLRALAAASFAFNGRWAFQAATGHAWHLAYGWVPLALWFLDRAFERGKLREATLAGATLALIVYLGGIYPLPHGALLLTMWALVTSVLRRSVRPLLALGIAAAVSVGLSAPKLLAIADTLGHTPRLIDSTEVIGLRELSAMLLDRSQRYNHFPVRVPAYNWHEWGIYVGPLVVVVMILGLLSGFRARGRAAQICGFGFLMLGFGAFHSSSPWALLHQVPPFSSQHVPSRFFFLAVLLLVLSGVAWLSPRVEKLGVLVPGVDLALLLVVGVVVADMTHVSSRPLREAFWMRSPELPATDEPFEHHLRPTVAYVVRDWATPTLLSMMVNDGVLQCYGVPESHVTGVIPVEDPRSRGLTWLESGSGSTRLVEWSPNRAVVEVDAAQPGDRVLYNMSFDPSWRANGHPAEEVRSLVGAAVPPGRSLVVFRYYPRTLWISIPLLLTTLTALLWWWRASFAACWQRFVPRPSRSDNEAA